MRRPQVNPVPSTPGPVSSVTALSGESTSPAIHTLVVEPDDGKTMVLATITAAHDNLTFTIYEITDPDIVAALVAAQGRGVAVRVLYNNASFASMNESNPNVSTVANSSRAGVATKPASPVFTVTPQKTLTAVQSVNQDFFIRNFLRRPAMKMYGYNPPQSPEHVGL